MPFKSKAQMRKFAAMEKEGKLPKSTFKKWLKHTANPEKLPKRVRKKPKRFRNS